VERKIYILQLKGVCADCGTAIKKMLATGGRASQIISAKQVTSSVRSGVDVVVIPGGYDYDAAMADLERRNAATFITQHVNSGGIYMGHCLGGDMAPLLNIFPGRVTNPAPNKGPLAARTLWNDSSSSRWLYFEDGPRFMPTRPVTVLATFADTDANMGINAGDAAVITYPWGEGEVGLLSPHPEADEEWLAQIDDPDGLDYDLGLYVYDQVLGKD
jgi:glutamine amidotransferase-like uncharacterized protein